MKPNRVSVLLNASSKQLDANRDQLLRDLESAFAQHSISASLELVKGGDLRNTASRMRERVAAGELDAIIVGGGDGSISTVAGIVAGTDVPLGVVPLGTLNHFAKDVGIPMSIEEAVATIAAGSTRRVDAAEVNDRIFLNNSSIGIYPFLVLDRERRRGREGIPKWLAMILAGLRALQYFPLRRLRIQTAGGSEAYQSPCVLIGNNIYELNAPSLGSRKQVDEGQLSVYVAKQQGRLALLWLACRSVIGLLDQERDLVTLTVPAVDISSHRRRMLVAFDGEVEIMSLPLRYQIRPGALRVFAPATSSTA